MREAARSVITATATPTGTRAVMVAVRTANRRGLTSLARAGTGPRAGVKILGVRIAAPTAGMLRPELAG